MIRQIADTVVVFDAEWIPDVETARRVYGLAEHVPDDDVRRRMWAEAGATLDNPRPYLKTILCRVVSISAVVREATRGTPAQLSLRSLPRIGDPVLPETELIERFLEHELGRKNAQLVGYNSSGADIPILVQRGVASGISAPGFSRRPEKPWEGRDYFARNADWSIDLMGILNPWGRSAPSLHQIASAAGIPGKMGVSGADVLDLWLDGDIRSVVEYNEYDALTTYLLWLRIAHFAGLLTTEQYLAEQTQLERLLERRAGETPHLGLYLDRWRELRRRAPSSPPPG